MGACCSASPSSRVLTLWADRISLKSLRWENFRWTGPGRGPERGEGRNRPNLHIAGMSDQN